MQKCGISKTYVAMLKEVNQKLKMMTSVSFKPYNNTLLYNFTIQNVFKSFEMSSQKKVIRNISLMLENLLYFWVNYIDTLEVQLN